jgi:hypothetical protein
MWDGCHHSEGFFATNWTTVNSSSTYVVSAFVLVIVHVWRADLYSLEWRLVTVWHLPYKTRSEEATPLVLAAANVQGDVNTVSLFSDAYWEDAEARTDRHANMLAPTTTWRQQQYKPAQNCALCSSLSTHGHVQHCLQPFRYFKTLPYLAAPIRNHSSNKMSHNCKGRTL